MSHPGPQPTGTGTTAAGPVGQLVDAAAARFGDAPVSPYDDSARRWVCLRDEAHELKLWLIRVNGVVYEDSLSAAMGERLNAAATVLFRALARSDLVHTDNTLVLHGLRGTRMPDYASTCLWLGNAGYRGSDYENFTDLWRLPVATATAAVPADTSVRIVIAVNMTLNRTVPELLATLLHEWHVHGAAFGGAVAEIRAGRGLAALQALHRQGAREREAQEHRDYANWSDEAIAAKVGLLGLDEPTAAAVTAKLKADRDRHDKTTGACL